MAPKKDPKRRPRKPQFEVGERVLCFRGPLLYEAECMKVSVKYRKVKYLVHYLGGNEKGAMRTRLAEKLARMEAQQTQKAGEVNKAQESGEMSESYKAPKTIEISEAGEGPESLKVCVIREIDEAVPVRDEATEAQAIPEIPEATEICEIHGAHAIREACEAGEVQEAARGLDEATEARDEATKTSDEDTETHEATKTSDEVTETHEATKSCDEATKVCAKRKGRKRRKGRKSRASCEVTEVPETHMAPIIHEAREAAAAREISEAMKAQEAAATHEIPEIIEVCETAEASVTFKASESQDSHATTEDIKTSESHENSEVGEASVSCETIETSETRKVSEPSKEQVGGKSKTKRKHRRKKAKAKTDAGCFSTEDDDVASQDPLSPTASWDDEWVPESRLLKYSEINLQKQRELFKVHQDQSAKEKMIGLASGKKTSKGSKQNPVVSSASVKAKGKNQNVVTETDSGSTGRRDGSSTGRRDDSSSGRRDDSSIRSRVCSSSSETPQLPRWRRRAVVNADGEPSGGLMRRIDFKINIPIELKSCLVEDWNMITKQKKIFCLPAKKNVDSILEDYELYEQSYANSEEKIYAIPEIVAGIRAYFNVMLGSHLLYKFERPQYATILADEPGVPMSQIYGAPHLLRLFVKIGDMLSYTFFDNHSTTLLLRYLHDFVNYLAKYSAALFSANDYKLASPEYLQKAAEEPENVCPS